MPGGHESSGGTPAGDQDVVVITGASRGIGAATAVRVAGRGAHVVLNYREKAGRAQRVVDAVLSRGGSCTAVRADLTDPMAVSEMFRFVRRVHGRVDVLVLNASGGMERNSGPDYAMRLNRDAQVSVLKHCLALMPRGGRVVFVTSHQAHFARFDLPAYADVARSKRAGEDAIRARIPELRAHGVDLVVVSGDIVAGTVTATLLERAEPGLLETRRAEAGSLVTIETFSAEVARATTGTYESGHTVYVGDTCQRECTCSHRRAPRITGPDGVATRR